MLLVELEVVSSPEGLARGLFEALRRLIGLSAWSRASRVAQPTTHVPRSERVLRIIPVIPPDVDILVRRTFEVDVARRVRVHRIGNFPVGLEALEFRLFELDIGMS
ncbi:MAG TPA: hypothetical protein VK116_15155, partial [Planctomycetota bacterium]|nr:hypothetical protein [Planctomycetota bacterium]